MPMDSSKPPKPDLLLDDLEAIRQLARAGIKTKLPVTVLFTPDEEVGSPSTRDVIEAEAAQA